MAIVLDATVGGPDANAYLTAVAATDRILIDPAAWTAADVETQDRLLIAATARLDRFGFQGELNDQAQALAFPRSGLFDREGRALPSDEIPAAVLDATAQLANCWLASGVGAAINTSANVRAQRVGPLEQEFFAPSSGTTPAHEVDEICVRKVRGGLGFLLLNNFGRTVHKVVRVQ